MINRTSGGRAELVGASRFFNNAHISEQTLIEASGGRCAQAVAGRRVLAIQDTTEMNYQKHRGRLKDDDRQLGPVGNNRDIGFFLHPMLVVDRDDGLALGFAATQVWNRHWDKLNKHERDYPRQALEEKESYRWIESAEQAKQTLCQAQHVTVIADREGDIYEEFTRIPDAQTDVLIRSRSDRRVQDEAGRMLYEVLAQAPCQGQYTVHISHGNKKRQHRRALMEVRYQKVRVCRPQGVPHSEPETIEVYAVEARESAETAVAGEPALIWRLLTTRPIATLAHAQELIEDYAKRWLIEELFRTLKHQGLELEASQLESGAALRRLAIMSLNVALIVMQLVGGRDGEQTRPATLVFNAQEISCLKQLCPRYEGNTVKQQNPFEPDTLAWAAWIIGRLGGWKGYRKAGPAGPISMKRGLIEFSAIFQGWSLFQASIRGHGGPEDVCIE